MAGAPFILQDAEMLVFSRRTGLNITSRTVMKLASSLLRLPALLLALPLAASATVYKWTDERGTTVYSNRPPAAETKVSNVLVILEDDKPAAAPKPDNANDLQGRVRALEQQVQSLQTQASAQVPDYAPPYPAQLPPPTSYYAPPDYYPPPSYPSDYAPPMYGYGYPYYPYAASYVVVAPRRFAHPVHHGFVGHRFGVHPMPVTRAMGVPVTRAVGVPVTRAMGVAHRR
jgi:Domain of unknown function (DUF4124)